MDCRIPWFGRAWILVLGRAGGFVICISDCFINIALLLRYPASDPFPDRSAASPSVGSHGHGAMSCDSISPPSPRTGTAFFRLLRVETSISSLEKGIHSTTCTCAYEVHIRNMLAHANIIVAIKHRGLHALHACMLVPCMDCREIHFASHIHNHISHPRKWGKVRYITLQKLATRNFLTSRSVRVISLFVENLLPRANLSASWPRGPGRLPSENRQLLSNSHHRVWGRKEKRPATLAKCHDAQNPYRKIESRKEAKERIPSKT